MRHIHCWDMVGQFEGLGNVHYLEHVRQTFWKFVYDWRTRQPKIGDGFPTTNVYSELNSDTRYLREQIEQVKGKVSAENGQQQEAIVRMAVAFRLVPHRVHPIGSQSIFEAFGGIPYDHELFEKFIDYLKFQQVGYDGLVSTLPRVEKQIAELLQHCGSVTAFVNHIAQNVKSIAKYVAQQIAADLVEHGIVVGNENDFFVFSPGAKAAVRLMYPGSKTEKQVLEKVTLLQKTQREEFAKLGVTFPFWNGKEISLKNFDRALHEFWKHYSTVYRSQGGK